MSASPVKTARPLSPHLQVYKPQLTAGMSIFHRFTGIGLTLGLPVFVWWLLSLAKNDATYNQVTDFICSPTGQVFLLGWTWAFFYHFCNGIRHLIWDTGRMLTIKNVYISGYIVLALSFLVSLFIWANTIGWSGIGGVLLQSIYVGLGCGVPLLFLAWAVNFALGFLPKNRTEKSLRSPLGRARGLGSAKNGTAQWWAMRVSSLVLIPLCLYVCITFFTIVVGHGYNGALHWVHAPLTSVFLILFLIVGFQHAVSGIQEVVEDYVHNEYAKIATMIAVRLIAAIFALFGIFAVLSIQFQVLIAYAK